MATSTFECLICLEDNLPPSSRFAIEGCCAHSGSFCTGCIALYITSNIQHDNPLVGCPVCSWSFDPIPCRQLVSREIFDRWCDLLLHWDLIGRERCYCPNRGCRELIVDECGGGAIKIWCPSSRKRCCFRCGSLWEDRGHLCTDFNAAIRIKEWKRCPCCKNLAGCFEGRETVKCRCRAEFCYYCRSTSLLGSGRCVCRDEDTRQAFYYFGYLLVVLGECLLLLVIIQDFIPYMMK